MAIFRDSHRRAGDEIADAILDLGSVSKSELVVDSRKPES